MSYTPKGRTREKILDFVRERILDGRPPTVREVQAAFGFRAVETARRHLENLIAEGQLGREAGKARGYRLPESQGLVHIPLLGRVQAGALTTAVEEPEGYIPVLSGRGRGDLFALRVRGESMTGAGILPGDIAIVRRQSAVDSGDIAVALVGDEATVKRVRLRDGLIELHAENPAFPPIIPLSGELLILGKVIEIRRYLESAGECIPRGLPRGMRANDDGLVKNRFAKSSTMGVIPFKDRSIPCGLPQEASIDGEEWS